VILTRKIVARLVALGIVTAILQVTFFSKIELFGASPDAAVLVVMILGLLGGSVAGAVGGFSIGLLIDCLLLETMGAFAASLMAVGYLSGRYRESVGGPNRASLPILGGAMTLFGLLTFAAIQVGIGIDAEVSSRVIGDALVKTLLGAALALPVYLLVRLVLRPALVEDRPSGRRPSAPRVAETRS
jgi:rod shape-determining protein MreD